jgi:ferredoxin
LWIVDFRVLTDLVRRAPNCVKDTACVEVCPGDCIQPRNEEAEFLAAAQLYLDPDDGIDCGACVPACPASAIYPVEDLPERWKKVAAIKAEWHAAKIT